MRAVADLSVGIFSKDLPPFAYGGIETYTYELSRRLAKLGCRVSVICARPASIHWKKMQIDDVKVYFVNSAPNISLTMRSLSFSINATRMALDLKQMQPFDLYHGQYIYGLGHALAKAIGKEKKPFINTVHNLIFRDINACVDNLFLHKNFLIPKVLAEILVQTPLALAEQKLICKMADRIIAVSQSTRKDCVKYCGVSIANISVVPNGVDINRFSPNVLGDKIRKALNIEDQPLILYIGGLDRRKGVGYLILAARLVLKEINNTKFLLVGKGPQEVFLKRLVRKLGIQDSFIFWPNVDGNSLPRVYASANLFVLPSLWEGFAISLLEAMSTAKPVVSTNTGAIPEVVVHNETGLLSEPGNHLQLAKNIIRILSDKRFAEKLGSNGRKRAEAKFSWDLVARKTLEVYEKTLRLHGS